MNTEAQYEEAVARLRSEVENAAGHTMMTPKDFDHLTEHVMKRTGQRLSPTTLKRLWGYMHDGGKPRRTTLNILALYLGYSSIEAFIEETTVAHEHPATRMQWVRLAATLLLLVAAGAFGSWAYQAATSPKVYYDIVARFQVGNLVYESWGGGLVAVRGVKSKDNCVEIPSSVKKWRCKLSRAGGDAQRFQRLPSTPHCGTPQLRAQHHARCFQFCHCLAENCLPLCYTTKHRQQVLAVPDY